MSETTESSQYDGRDEQHVGRLQRGEFAVALGTAAVAVVVGVWVGVWAIPDAALAVPTSDAYGEAHAAYQPVPNGLPLISVLVVGGGLYGAWKVLTPPENSDEEEEEATPATDGGTSTMEQLELQQRAERADRLEKRAKDLAEENHELRNRMYEISAEAYELGREHEREGVEYE